MSTTDDGPGTTGKSDTDGGNGTVPADEATTGASATEASDEATTASDADVEADVEAAASTDDATTAAEAADGDADGDATPAAGTATRSRLADQRAARSAERSTRNGSGGFARSAKRYGPFVLIAVILVGAIAVFSGGGDDGGDDDGGDTEASGALDEDQLIADGPMTPQKAEAEGVDVDFGPNCDTDRGLVAIPTVYAAPCVEPFEGDNGGATSMGVTEDEILVVRYETDPDVDPIGASLVRATGVETNPATAFQTAEEFGDIFAEYYETYGRTVRFEEFLGSGPSDDEAAARADAIEIADMQPFAVIGGPAQSSAVFASELADAGIMCVASCAQALPDEVADPHEGFLFQTGPTPNQAAAMAAELIAKMAGPGPATMAGDPALQEADRRYALVHYDTEAGTHTAVAEALSDSLADNGVELSADVPYVLDPAAIQEDARTIIARLESDEITTVIFYGDPLMPKALTDEATAQDFRPEWILGPSLLADTAVFGRSFDQTQWGNGFGVGLNPLRGEDEVADSWILFDWAYGQEPPNNAYAAIYPGVRAIFTGIHLAGPELTPESFRDGLFRQPVAGGYPSRAQLSYGSQGVWGDDVVDYGGSEDASIVWWDPDAEGTDETGQQGRGMYRHANGGERYTIGDFPDSPEDAGLFVTGDSLTIVDELPPEAVFDYPAPDLG